MPFEMNHILLDVIGRHHRRPDWRRRWGQSHRSNPTHLPFSARKRPPGRRNKSTRWSAAAVCLTTLFSSLFSWKKGPWCLSAHWLIGQSGPPHKTATFEVSKPERVRSLSTARIVSELIWQNAPTQRQLHPGALSFWLSAWLQLFTNRCWEITPQIFFTTYRGISVHNTTNILHNSPGYFSPHSTAAVKHHQFNTVRKASETVRMPTDTQTAQKQHVFVVLASSPISSQTKLSQLLWRCSIFFQLRHHRKMCDCQSIPGVMQQPSNRELKNIGQLQASEIRREFAINATTINLPVSSHWRVEWLQVSRLPIS